MELSDYARALRKGWYLVAICFVLALSTAAVITARSPSVYSATITMFVSFIAAVDTEVDAHALYNSNLAGEKRVESYADLVGGERVASDVIKKLDLDESPAELATRVQGSAVADTVLLEVSVTDRNPGRAQQIANTVGDVFSRQITEIETPAAGQDAPVRVIVWEHAKRPSTPVSPRPVVNLVIGLVSGLAIGIGLAVLRFRLDTTIRRPEDVADVVAIPVLGAVAYDKDAARTPLVLQASPTAPRSESYRQLRTNLQFFDVDVDSHPRLVAVTSAQAAEGKTTTACNLAIALAQTGATVVLVEADLRRPAFGRYLGVSNASGLTSVLIGRAALDDVLQTFGDWQVAALPCGPRPPNPSELLGSQAMAAVLDELRARFDYVIMDVPPLLPVADSAVVSALADGTLLVVRAGRTRRAQLRQAVTLLDNIRARSLGVVLNMMPAKGQGSFGCSQAYVSGGRRLDEPAYPLRPAPAVPRRNGRGAEPAHEGRRSKGTFEPLDVVDLQGRRSAFQQEETPGSPPRARDNHLRIDDAVGVTAAVALGTEVHPRRRGDEYLDTTPRPQGRANRDGE